MTDGNNVVPLFSSGDTSKEKDRKEPPFFRFPQEARYEVVSAGTWPTPQLIISLGPEASEIVKKTWPNYLRSIAAALILAGVEHRIEVTSGHGGAPDVPDFIRINLHHK